MGVLEKESRKKTRNRNIQRAVLSAVALSGGLLVVALAPNALTLLKQFPGWQKGKRQSIYNARTRLIKAGLLAYEGKHLILTSKGKTKLRQLELHDFQIKRPKKWDGKWRMLIFDIKEERKFLREKVRRTLVAIGFVRLQDSVWIYPYDCEDLVALLKADFKVGKDLLYLIIDSLENDSWVRKRFGLPA